MNEPIKSDTPRTDNAELDLINSQPGLDEKRVMSAFDFARQLERELQTVTEILLSCINDEAAPIEDLAQRVVAWADKKEHELNAYLRAEPLKLAERNQLRDELNQWKECANELVISFKGACAYSNLNNEWVDDQLLHYNQLKQGEGK